MSRPHGSAPCGHVPDDIPPWKNMAVIARTQELMRVRGMAHERAYFVACREHLLRTQPGMYRLVYDEVFGILLAPGVQPVAPLTLCLMGPKPTTYEAPPTSVPAVGQSPVATDAGEVDEDITALVGEGKLLLMGGADAEPAQERPRSPVPPDTPRPDAVAEGDAAPGRAALQYVFSGKASGRDDTGSEEARLRAALTSLNALGAW